MTLGKILADCSSGGQELLIKNSILGLGKKNFKTIRASLPLAQKNQFKSISNLNQQLMRAGLKITLVKAHFVLMDKLGLKQLS